MSTMPPAIYFDTNALIKGGFDLRNGVMARIRGKAEDLEIRLYAPQIAVDEWIHHSSTQVSTKLKTVTSQCGEINQMTGKCSISVNFSDTSTIIREAEDANLLRLKKAGLVTIPNVPPPIEDLMKRAVTKVPPFEPRDRGFRDTIIFESIVAHAGANFPSASVLIISDDGAIKKAADSLGAERGQLMVSKLEDAPDFIDRSLDEALKETLEKEREIAWSLVEANSETVFRYAETQLGPGSSLLPEETLGMSLCSVDCIRAVRPQKLAWVQPRQHFTLSCATGEDVPILIGVAVEYDLVIKEFTTQAPRMFDCGVSVVEPLCFGLPEPVPHELTVQRTVTLEATARLTSHGDLSDLYILSDAERGENLLPASGLSVGN